MKPFATKLLLAKISLFLFSFGTFLAAFVLFCSFATHRLGDDFLKQLGITKATADEKIGNSMLNGYLDAYGVKNAKNIAAGNRRAVVLDLLAYTKQQVSGPVFLKKYNELRNSYKPTESIPQTPDELKAQTLDNAKKAVANMQEAVKKADANSKGIFEKLLVDAQKQLKDAEDPNYKQYVLYTKNYPSLVKTMKESYTFQLAQWEKKYPASPLPMVKERLLEFLNATKDIDFGAELTTRNGKKYFVNPAYERKDSRWKMAFRAGKEVVEPAREFVQKWVEEIK